MKKALLFTFCLYFSTILFSQIIADHTVVDQFDKIPQYYLNEVKKMWLSYPGESHAYGFMNGLEAFEALYPAYSVDTKNYTEGGTPDGYTDQNLRASTALWGDYVYRSGWIYIIGEDDWWTNSTGISQVKTSLSYCNTNGPALSALGFGWCWDHTRENVSSAVDPVTGNHWYGKSVGGSDGDRAWGIDESDNAVTGNRVNMNTYLAATQSYVDYCVAQGIPTKVFFSTAPPDDWDGTIGVEALFQGYLKNEHIRKYVKSDPSRILFDYADILCYNDANTLATATWNGNEFPTYHPDNNGGGYIGGHVGKVGEIRLAKAMWWMLARIAGWDGNVTGIVDNNQVTNLFKIVSEAETLTIQMLKTNLVGTVNLYSSQGTIIESEQIKDDLCVLDTKSISPGIYIIIVRTDYGQQSQKIIKL